MSGPTQIMCFSPEILRAFKVCHYFSAITGYKIGISCYSLKCVVNVQQTKSWQISKELHILRVHEKVFHLLGWWQVRFAKKLPSKLPSFENWGARFPVGKIIYWVGMQFWAMPTQLTCYLPPWSSLLCNYWLLPSTWEVVSSIPRLEWQVFCDTENTEKSQKFSLFIHNARYRTAIFIHYFVDAGDPDHQQTPCLCWM